jgi:hypothetical protein
VPIAIGKPVLIFAVCTPLDFEIESTVRHAAQAARALAPNFLAMLDSARIDVTRFKVDAFLGDCG